MIGNLPDKDLAMLEERIKRATKTRQVHTDSVGVYLAVVQVYFLLLR